MAKPIVSPTSPNNMAPVISSSFTSVAFLRFICRYKDRYLFSLKYFSIFGPGFHLPLKV